ncbi:putative glycosyl transferase [Posidoniimonas polymericola]|uniref:Putative glycosyl transferase n=1 Tax=Posidoniimonas polymericola TaxID=2528002 RepID=A0A5C5YV56_9BACT|nr:glycosyltransferase family 4 protein [Posidoniimonas polymericola]TWT78417.1 putative glycosyl transferase [Posidoniimonas polymericola]
MSAKRLVLLYHFFAPDDVVSSVLYSELGAELAKRGWQVEAWPSNRLHSGGNASLPHSEALDGVRVTRVWRPAWVQSSGLGRMLNAVWMVGSWGLRAAFTRRHQHEVMLVGTDPVMGVSAAVPWKLFRRHSRVAHWCFDLYPEAAVADEKMKAGSLTERLFSWVSRLGYRRCDLIADLGPCMRDRLAPNAGTAAAETITPWALVEPPEPPEPDSGVRSDLFGDAKLALLYSGSFGRAHSYAEFLDLARELRGDGVRFCFAGRGHRADELKAAVGPDDENVSFTGFAPEAELEKRLTSCDLHLVSLTPEWTGTVVPSKFFGALAAGRGVLFAGSEQSAIAQWIRQHNVGWVVTPDTVGEVADELRRLAQDPERLVALRQHCHAVYHAHFSRQKMIDKWDAELTRLLEP